MRNLLSVEELEERLPAGTLPLAPDSDETDSRRVETALNDATGIIVSQLPWLLDKESAPTSPCTS